MTLNPMQKKVLNNIIEEIKKAERALEGHQANSELPAKEWGERYEELVSKLNSTLGRLEDVTFTLHCRNLCEGTQKSINYYRKKGGLPSLKVTAFI